jgi:hypothetical protein
MSYFKFDHHLKKCSVIAFRIQIHLTICNFLLGQVSATFGQCKMYLPAAQHFEAGEQSRWSDQKFVSFRAVNRRNLVFIAHCFAVKRLKVALETWPGGVLDERVEWKAAALSASRPMHLSL